MAPEALELSHVRREQQRFNGVASGAEVALRSHLSGLFKRVREASSEPPLSWQRTHPSSSGTSSGATGGDGGGGRGGGCGSRHGGSGSGGRGARVAAGTRPSPLWRGGGEGAARERPPRQAALLASISAGAAEAGDAEQAASYIVQSRSHHFKQPAVTPVVRLRLTVAAGGCVQALVVTRSVCCYCGQRFGETGCAARKQHERGCAGRRANAARADREAGGLSEVEPAVRLRLTAAAGGGVQARVATRSVCYHCERRFINAGWRPQHERGCASRGPEHWSAENGRPVGKSSAHPNTTALSRQHSLLRTDLVGSEPRSGASRSGVPRKLQFACPK